MSTSRMKRHTLEDKFWRDEKGIECPISRVSKTEKLKEKEAFNVANKAIKINEELVALKKYLGDITEKVFTQMAQENNTEAESKGNITWFNFDRSIKVERRINERIDFDGTLIQLCKSKLDEFLGENLSNTEELVKNLVTDAFSTSRGKLDSKKVMSLLKYRSKIKDARFQEALNLLEKSIFRPSSKTYYTVSVIQEDGSYQAIEMNFASI